MLMYYYSVADIKMYWQKTGDYLAVKVDRYAKSRRDEKGEMKFSVSGIVELYIVTP